MSYPLQNYLVYLIVAATSIRLLYPFLKFLYQKFISKTPAAKQNEYSCYSSCASCGVKQ
ncbi:MAG: hypothetical protein AAF518_16290 [Spirochaetota bacterium]